MNPEIYNFLNNSTYLISQSQIKDFGNIKFSNNNIKSTKCSAPIFSIIIIFIDFQTFEKTIESIKKQSFNNYEIFVIYNLDEKLDILPKNDNWKIISNKSKKGLIYLYSIGILASKGNYILTLQSGYILFEINSLYNIYQISKENNFDIYEFNLLINNTEQIKNVSLILYKCGHFETNIDLKIIKTNDNYIDIYKNEEILSNKLIESKFFKNLINKYKLYQINKNIYNYFEIIFLFILFTKDIKFKRNDIIGLIIYIKDFNRIQNVDKSKMRDSIPYINFLFDNTDNSFNGKQLALNEFMNHLSTIYNKYILVSLEALKLLKKFLNCKYIRLEDKNELNFYYKSLIN